MRGEVWEVRSYTRNSFLIARSSQLLNNLSISIRFQHRLNCVNFALLIASIENSSSCKKHRCTFKILQKTILLNNKLTINVSRPINYVTSYTTSTSDHYPVNARFKFGIPATIKSVASGNWSLPATWDCNCVPQSINNVIVDTPHTVTVDVASLAKNVEVKGILNYISALMLSLGL